MARVGPEACLRDHLTGLAALAFRRELSSGDRTAIEQAFDEALATGRAPVDAAGVVLQVVLQSPDFLYRTDLLPGGERASPLGDEELAARVSFAFWHPMASRVTARTSERERVEELGARDALVLDDPLPQAHDLRRGDGKSLRAGGRVEGAACGLAVGGHDLSVREFGARARP